MKLKKRDVNRVGDPGNSRCCSSGVADNSHRGLAALLRQYCISIDLTMHDLMILLLHPAP